MKITNEMRIKNRNTWSRRLAFQAIYSWSINNSDLDDLISSYSKDENYVKSNNDYFNEIVFGVINNISAIDKSIDKISDIDISNINFIELSILRCFIFELGYNKKFPNEVLISESVKLATKFGGQDSYKFVNAFLDSFVKKGLHEKNN
tara:strand:+ start:1344 stop:1787 length:444 start_codon:yes stop_codon:yes gene_type:complete